MSKIDHIGIATNSIVDAVPFWEALGFTSAGGGVVEEQGVNIRYMMNDSEARIELLEPTGADTPVGRFIESKGTGIQQLAISVDDINQTISNLLEMGIRMINTEPQIGHGGNKIAFVHPSSSGGVLVELVEYI
jgi:methylmalonyl-CoA/ethylmalonyl-CoA epimerase